VKVRRSSINSTGANAAGVVAVLLGLAGGIFPPIRAARLPIIAALRED
jgi:ABC-type nitrate/sulfonate/bicarbonate transport system permease component